MKNLPIITIFFSLWLSGCAILSIDPPPDNVPQGPNALWVVAPIDPQSETFTVRFGRDFVPGTFAAQLDGNDITQLWQPGNPVPNGSAKLFYADIFKGGSCFAGTPPWKSQWWPPVSPTFCTHTLHVHGDVANAASYPMTFTDRSVDFVPVQLGLIAKVAGLYLAPDDTLPLGPGQSVTVTLTAATYGPWPQEQTVVVAALDQFSGDNPAGYISLNGLPPGQPVFLNTIPGDFTVTVLGNLEPGPVRFVFRLRARAFGCQEAEYSKLYACRDGGC
jgi:hypothetical protein